MDLSVLIPTRRRPEHLARCVAALCGQGGATFEVLVGVDGPDGGESARAAHGAWTAAGGRLRVIQCPRVGLPAVRNRLIDAARAPVILFLNDDVVPRAGCLRVHAGTHRSLAARGEEALVVGGSPWRVFPDDSLFDRMIRETSMVFFHDRMRAGAGRRWGFRHAFGLNLSGATEVFRRVRFLEVGALYGHDDIEFAFRAGLPVLYRPAARVVHDHRLRASEYLAREFALGQSAAAYARTNPAFAGAVYRRDVLDARSAVLALKRLTPRAASRLGWFVRLASRPPKASAATIARLYRRHLPLKRWAWHVGLLAALTER